MKRLNPNYLLVPVLGITTVIGATACSGDYETPALTCAQGNVNGGDFTTGVTNASTSYGLHLDGERIGQISQDLSIKQGQQRAAVTTFSLLVGPDGLVVDQQLGPCNQNYTGYAQRIPSFGTPTTPRG